jgi:putative Mg2+ transporter-C (MgtC) family protein
MFNSFDLISMGQVLLAFILGGAIGYEREYHDSPAGVRTYAAVCMGSCLFGIASIHPQGFSVYHSMYDPTRIAAQVASGVGHGNRTAFFEQPAPK